MSQLKDRKGRLRENVFLIEGEKELLHAINGQIKFETILYCPKIMADNNQLCSVDSFNEFSQLKDAQWFEVSEQVFAKVAYRDKAGGILAVAGTPSITIEQLKLSKNPFILVVHGVEKPGNLGAILRTADGAGVDAVIVCEPEIDLYNPNVVRASLGALFTVQVLALSSDKTVEWLIANEIKIVVSTPSATQDYHTFDYKGPIALVVGSEKDGVSQQWLETQIDQVRIDMKGQMDSLNVSCSTAILLYEALRQRS